MKEIQQGKSVPFSFIQLTKTFYLPQFLRNTPIIRIDQYASTTDEIQQNSNSQTQSVNSSQMLYDNYLKTNFKEQYIDNNQSLIKQEETNDSIFNYNRSNSMMQDPSNEIFSQFFTTTASRIKNSRQQQYEKFKQKNAFAQKNKLKEENHYRDVDISFQDFHRDNSWKTIKKRINACSITERDRTTIFQNKKNECNDERRFNNFSTDVPRKVFVPNMENYSARKPILNNMQVPLFYYDGISKVYQKITFGETMDKCLFDYAKSAKKDRSILSKQKIKEEKLTRREVLELVKKQEVIDHNIEKIRNRLAINKAYPVPLFTAYMSRTRPSSQQNRVIPKNMNHFEDVQLKQEKDKMWATRSREFNRAITPGDWKKRSSKQQSIIKQNVVKSISNFNKLQIEIPKREII